MHQFADINLNANTAARLASNSHIGLQVSATSTTRVVLTMPMNIVSIVLQHAGMHARTCTLYVSRILSYAAYIRSDQAQTYTASGSLYFVGIIQKAREIMRRKDCKFKPAIATRLCYVNLLLPLYMHNKIVASYVKIYNIAS